LLLLTLSGDIYTTPYKKETLLLASSDVTMSWKPYENLLGLVCVAANLMKASLNMTFMEERSHNADKTCFHINS